LKKAYLFTNGSTAEFTQIINSIRKDDIIVGIDGGANFLYQKKIPVDLVIGDMDSIEPEILSFFRENSKVEIYPSEKDETDSELALRWCRNSGIKKIIFMNSLDRRFDHSLGLLSNLFTAKKFGLSACIENDLQKVFLADKTTLISAGKGSKLSLIPISKKVGAITTSGLKYRLIKDDLYRDSTRGISNECVQNKITISFEQGELLIIQNKNRCDHERRNKI